MTAAGLPSAAVDPALLAAVLADPWDDSPRLVLADWWDEHTGTVPCPKCTPNFQTNDGFGLGWLQGKDGSGYFNVGCENCGGGGLLDSDSNGRKGSGRISNGFSERAEFVRVQCELARGGKRLFHPNGHTDFKSGRSPWLNYDRDCTRKDCRGCALRRRERELLKKNWRDWTSQIGAPIACENLGAAVVGRTLGVRFARGGVASVALPWAAWVGGTPALGPLLAAAHPITAVRFTDREPAMVGRMWNWGPTFGDDPTRFRIPEVLWRILTERENGSAAYPTREAALTALSRAAVDWARSRAVGHTHRGVCKTCGGEGEFDVFEHGRESRKPKQMKCKVCSGTGEAELPGLPLIRWEDER